MDSVIKLNDTEADAMLTLASKVTAHPSGEPDTFCKQAQSLTDSIPSRLCMALDNFSRTGSPTGFLLIQTGLNLSSMLPPTPPNNLHHFGEETKIARIQAICVSALAEMVAYEAEGHGRLFQDIVPTQSMAHLQTSMGSAELEIHTEQAFSPLRPDYLSLACLRGDSAAFTYVMPVGAMLSQLSDSEQAFLKTPQWTCDVDLSFKLYGTSFIPEDEVVDPLRWETRGPMPILSGAQDPQLVFDQDLMTGVNEESEALVKKLVEIYYQKRHAHVFYPGDIMIIDNNRAVHGRSGFSPRYDGHDRFLVRCFGVKDIGRVRSAMGPLRRIMARYS